MAEMIDDELSRWPRLDLSEPSTELAAWAEREICEKPDTRLQSCAELRDMMYERGECIPHRTDDQFLLRFLRARNFCVPRAHRLLVNYCRLREVDAQESGDDPQCTRSPLIELARTLGEHGVIAIPPHLDLGGRRLLVFRPGKWRPDECGVEALLRATLACLELGVLEPRAQLLGGVCIFDLDGLRLEHALKVTPQVARRVVDLMSTSFPLRVHAVHVVRAPWPFRLAWRAFRPLVDGERRARLHLHGADLGTLHQHVGRDCLPVSLGGPRPDVSYKRWLLAMSDDDHILRELRSLGYRLHDHHIQQFVSDNQHLLPETNKKPIRSTAIVEDKDAAVAVL